MKEHFDLYAEGGEFEPTINLMRTNTQEKKGSISGFPSVPHQYRT